MATMPSTICRSAFSLNTTQAMSAVNTPSTFNRSEAAAAPVVARPVIKSAGPATPPTRIAPSSQGISRRGIDETAGAESPALAISLLASSTAVKPRPLPKYRRPARRIGEIAPVNVLAKGVLAPNSSAAAKAGAADRTDMSTVACRSTPVIVSHPGEFGVQSHATNGQRPQSSRQLVRQLQGAVGEHTDGPKRSWPPILSDDKPQGFITRITERWSTSFKGRYISCVTGSTAKLCAFGPAKPSLTFVTPVAVTLKIDSTPDSLAT